MISSCFPAISVLCPKLQLSSSVKRAAWNPKLFFPVRFKNPKLSLSIINFFAISVLIFITYKHLAVLVILIMSMHNNTAYLFDLNKSLFNLGGERPHWGRNYCFSNTDYYLEIQYFCVRELLQAIPISVELAREEFHESQKSSSDVLKAMDLKNLSCITNRKAYFIHN